MCARLPATRGLRSFDHVTAAAPTQTNRNWPASIYRRPDNTMEHDLAPLRIREVVQSGEGELWVDIDSTNNHQHALLEKIFEFHPLSIEDTLSPGTRVKLEEYGRYLFVVMAGLRFDSATPDPFDLETFNLYFFLGSNFLVTVHAIPSASCDAVRERLIRSPDPLARGAEMTMHGIIDQAVDAYFPLVEQLNDLVERLEEKVFDEFDRKLVHDIFKAKRTALALRRHVSPLREALNVLSNRPTTYIRPETQLYYRDIYDHTIRITESVDTTRDLLTGVLETYLSETSNRMNQVMKQLSIVATLALPLVVMGGIFGMNFSRMPLIHDPLGFFWALGGMAAVSAVILWWLRRSGWL